MSTQTTGDILAGMKDKYSLKDRPLTEQVVIPAPADQIIKMPILIKPKAPTWEELVAFLSPIVNFQGLWVTIAERYHAGYGAELITAAEIAMERHKKDKPNNYFAAAISKNSGKWDKLTLQTVRDTWEIRRNAQEVIDRLKLEPRVYLKVLSLAWKLKGTIVRFLSMATEQGTGIKNPAGIFFKLTAAAVQTAS